MDDVCSKKGVEVVFLWRRENKADGEKVAAKVPRPAREVEEGGEISCRASGRRMTHIPNQHSQPSNMETRGLDRVFSINHGDLEPYDDSARFTFTPDCICFDIFLHSKSLE